MVAAMLPCRHTKGAEYAIHFTESGKKKMLRNQTRAQKPVRKDSNELRDKCFKLRGVYGGCHSKCAICNFKKNYLEV